MEQEFSILENKTIGRNIYKFRKVKDVKAVDVAGYLGISESAYTKYERGETQITIDMIQKVAEYLKVDPLSVISTSSASIFESGNNSPGAIVGNNNVHTMTDEQTKIILTLIQSVATLNEKVIALLEKK